MKEIKAFISAAFAAIAAYLGNLIVPLMMLFVAAILDYITGRSKAYMLGTANSRVGHKGIVKKLFYAVEITVAIICDTLIGKGLAATGIDLKSKIYVTVLVTVWLILNELLSIIENLAEMGIPLPTFLKKFIKHLKVANEKSGEDLTPEDDYDPDGYLNEERSDESKRSD